MNLERKAILIRKPLIWQDLQDLDLLFLTAITTILGLVPMVFSLTIRFSDRDILVGAPSSQWWVDLSSTIAGGLTFATFLNSNSYSCLVGAR